MKISSISFRRKLSYVLLPAMILYTFQPYISYGGEARVIVTGEGSSGEELSVAAERDMASAEAVNAFNRANGARGGLNGGNADPSSSAASNYTMGIGANVNTQTGQLDLTFNNVKLAGITKETDVSVGISSSSERRSLLGLPAGWKFSLDYVDEESKEFHMNGSKNYKMDSTYYSYDSNKEKYYSGLRYYTSKAIKFQDLLKDMLLPYTKEQPEKKRLSYRYILTASSGCHEYFDRYGKLICQDDRFGNYVLYSYETIGGNKPTVYNVRLSAIRDSFGQEIKVSYTGTSLRCVTFTMPDSRTVVYDFSKIGIGEITLKDVTGLSSVLNLEGSKVKEIRYATGGVTKYHYDNTAIPYGKEQSGYFSGITEVINDPCDGGVETKTEYNYKLTGKSFAGAQQCDYLPGEDSLMQSNSNSYRYVTHITSKYDNDCGGDVTKIEKFNFLHLPLETEIWNKGNLLNRAETTYLGGGKGGFPAYNRLDSNYNLPSVVTNKIYGNSSSNGTSREKKVETKYDDYGRQVLVMRYNDGKETGHKATKYYPEYNLVESQTVYDAEDGTTTVRNMLSKEGGKYISSSGAVMSKNGASNKRIETELDEKGRIISETISSSGGLMNSNDSEFSTTRTSYSVNGNEFTVTVTDALGNTTKEVYDIRSGNLLRTIDGLEHEVKYEYSNNGLTVKKVYPDGSWEKTDNSEPKKSNEPKKSITSYSNGYEKSSELDGFGRPVMITDNRGHESKITYNKLGKASKVTDEFDHETSYTYDYKGRVRISKDYLGNKQETIYDDAAQTSEEYINDIKASNTYYDDNGNAVKKESLLSESDVNMLAVYNGQNQMKKASLSSGGEELATLAMEYDVDGSKLKAAMTTKDGTNASSEFQLDLFGNVIKRITNYKQVSPGIDIGVEESEVKKYNKAGQLESITDKLGHLTKCSYDANGNVVKVEFYRDSTPGKAADNTFTLTYDNMNRMESMSGSDIKVTNKYYTEVGPSQGKVKVTELYENGAITDSTAYTYDDRGRVSSVEYKNGKKMTFEYENDNLKAITDFAKNRTEYSYGGKEYPHRISKVSNKYGSAEYKYYDKSRGPLFGSGNMVEEVSYSNGVKVQFNYYDTAEGKGGGKKISPKLGSVKTFSSDKKLMSGTIYTYDKEKGTISQIEQISDTDENDINSNNIKKFDYNLLGRLLSEKVSSRGGKKIYETEFRYDTNGNITKRVIRDENEKVVSEKMYEYNKGDQLLNVREQKGSAKGEITTFEYDARGNMTRVVKNGAEAKVLKYNEFDQLVEYNDMNQNIHVCYEYNADGLRSSKYYKGSRDKMIKYYYNGGTVVNEENSEGVMTSYLIAGGSRVLRAIGEKNIQWYISNKKDVVGMASSDGTKKIETYQYSAYGEGVDLNNLTGEVEKKDSFDINYNPFGYSSYYFDEESGMYYLNARYYAPDIMRFISKDTFDLPNKYAYCDGDPISKFDPTGHNAETWVNFGVDAGIAIIGIIFAAIGLSVATGGLGTAGAIAGMVGAISGLAAVGTSLAEMQVTQGSDAQKALAYANLGLAIVGGLADATSIGLDIAGIIKRIRLTERAAADIARGNAGEGARVENVNRINPANNPVELQEFASPHPPASTSGRLLLHSDGPMSHESVFFVKDNNTFQRIDLFLLQKESLSDTKQLWALRGCEDVIKCKVCLLKDMSEGMQMCGMKTTISMTESWRKKLMATTSSSNWKIMFENGLQKEQINQAFRRVNESWNGTSYEVFSHNCQTYVFDFMNCIANP